MLAARFKVPPVAFCAGILHKVGSAVRNCKAVAAITKQGLGPAK